jgi:hypothetical protein
MGPSFATLDLARLDGVSDRVVVRDARGRSRRPALVPVAGPGRGGERRELLVCGGFSVVQSYRVSPEQGRAFVAASRDSNPIHTRGDVVPGAMTAARLILLPEVLIRGCTSERLRVKFRAVARYGHPTVHRYRFSVSAANGGTPIGAAGHTVEVRFEARQDGQTVAEGQLVARCAPPAAASREPQGPLAAAPDEIEAFLASLGVNAAAYFAWSGHRCPRAFLASLPAGEMVRQLEGEGGLLNSLELNFADAPPLEDSLPPLTVEVDAPPRRNSSFRKVLTRVAYGLQTCCQGIALVFSATG